jgi:CheY-like chemotaxis protein
MMPDQSVPLARRGDILVVEDTPASLWLLTSLLTKAGYRVRESGPSRRWCPVARQG